MTARVVTAFIIIYSPASTFVPVSVAISISVAISPPPVELFVRSCSLLSFLLPPLLLLVARLFAFVLHANDFNFILSFKDASNVEKNLSSP